LKSYESEKLLRTAVMMGVIKIVVERDWLKLVPTAMETLV